MEKKNQETHFFVEFRGLKYKVELLTPKKYVKKYPDQGDSSYAFFTREDKLLTFRTDHIQKNVVIHECSHLYFSQHYFASAEPSVETIDEIIAETNEDHLFSFIKFINEVHRKLRIAKKELKPIKEKNPN